MNCLSRQRSRGVTEKNCWRFYWQVHAAGFRQSFGGALGPHYGGLGNQKATRVMVTHGDNAKIKRTNFTPVAPLSNC